MHPDTPETTTQPVILKTAVSDMVQVTRRTGDLLRGQLGGVSALEGILGHQRLQRKRPPGYRAEITVRHLHHCGEFALEIGGRIDGVFSTASPPVIEEIKTTTRPFEDISPSQRVMHEAQVNIYAYLYALEHSLDRVGVQITYFNIDTGDTREDRQDLDITALASHFRAVVEDYLKWARLLYRWRQCRDHSVAELTFPHTHYREGQRRFAVAVYRCIQRQGRLFAQAPTGIGKTMGALFPAIKATALEGAEKIFFLTAKTTGVAIAESAFTTMARNGLRFKRLTITARDKACFNEGAACDPRSCEYALGYYDRLGNALEAFFERDDFTRTSLSEVARLHRVCPFELSLDLAVWADAIICDYNYAFDPGVHLRRLFGQKHNPNILLIYEAHNLVSRARGMFSAELQKSTVLAMRRLTRDTVPFLARALTAINRRMLGLKKSVSTKPDKKVAGELPASWRPAQSSRAAEYAREWWCDAPPSDLLPSLRRFCHAFESWIADTGTSPAPLTEFYFNVRRFIRTCDLGDAASKTLLKLGGKEIVVKRFNVDPSALLADALERNRASVFFSATLSPANYYTRLLNGEAAHDRIGLHAPFPRERLCLMVADRIDTSYRGRESSRDQVVAMIAAVVGQKPGNYLIYFPSYKYLQAVYSDFSATHPRWKTLVQDRAMNDAARAAFIQQFAADSDKTLIGFAVMGGAFGEGIDLPGDRLIGVVVVGVGLPQLCLERDLIKDHFETPAPFENTGFGFAYRIPGMNRVLQTVGRVIRGEEDRGVACLIDRRFSTPAYRALFPDHWRPQTMATPEQVERTLAAFWNPAV